MIKSSRKQSNELEFQGQVIVWLNEEIKKRPGLKLDKATQEKPRKESGKRSDLVVWTDRANELAFLALELKTPTTPINDPVFFADAIEKARHWKAKYFALWNMRELEVYETPAQGHDPLPTNAIRKSALPLAITQVEEWLKPAFAAELRNQTIEILDAAIDHQTTGKVAGHTIDADIFVARITEVIGSLRGIFYRDLTKAAGTNRNLRRQLTNIAAEQGFQGFVKDIDYAIAGQIGYRFIGQILFYFALRRKIPALKDIVIAARDKLPDALQTYWNDVRRYDYEALFKPEPIEALIPIASEAQVIIRHFIEQLSSYDWASLTDDVLGSIFEHLIPREEQILLGQFYTPRPVADLLVAFTIDGERPLVLDPGCGSGTFLMSAYIHSKEGREHCHVVWSRIDLDSMTAISDSNNYYKHEKVARALEREFGHERVQGALIERDGKERPARTPSHSEMLQAERTGVSPAAARALMTDLWRETDSGKNFQAALETKWWVLARGDRRDFVAIDSEGGTHSIARRIEGAKAADVRQRFADIDPASLPSVAEAKTMQRERQVEREREREQDRTAVRPAAARALMTELWRETENGKTFQAALEKKWWVLARGDQRNFVAIDSEGGVHSVARRIEGAKAADVQRRFADLDPKSLPTVDEAKKLQHARQGERARQAGARAIERSRPDADHARASAGPRTKTPAIGRIARPAAKIAGSVFSALMGEKPTPPKEKGSDASPDTKNEGMPSERRQQLMRQLSREVSQETERDAEYEVDKGRERSRG